MYADGLKISRKEYIPAEEQRGAYMQAIPKDDLLISLSVLWQKFAEVAAALEKRLRAKGDADLERVMSRAWEPLRKLIGEGLAEQEIDAGVVVCRLTRAGVARKQQLLEASLESAQ